MFKDPDDDSESLVSSFGTFEDALLSLSMAGNAATFIKNRLLHPSSREEEPDFDHINLCNDDQYIVHAMNRDEMVHELFNDIIEAMFHHFIARNRYSHPRLQLARMHLDEKEC